MKNESTFSCSGEPVTTTAQWIKSQIKDEEIEKYLKDGKDFIDDEKIERLISEKTNPTREKIEEARKGIKIPVYLGSGITAENAAELLSVSDGAIVGSAFKTNGNMKEIVDYNRAKAFMDEVRKIRG